ncbi:DUF421 domain-containing protein [Rubrivivax gelatinosus]|uniref:YetF C-terminal domain-containing protein n=2 Tax=Rubrivivax gelatinosus TaxID=28068 RepID=I0HS61_RUBGI|nr:YetF domain-containing protein [Rubrivivax gelatinosus]MBG6082376.1 uncharacterized membrane protein YcaP (DUF421 family) [Rubrivivax gelatinosus]BAL95848.1 hypothetical protein RGE_25070 [Rubrivivax gelatinosus IL144]
MTLADLAALWRFDVPPLEIVLRGTLMYWFLFLLFRFALRRDSGSIGIADILLLVLVADASQNAMAGGYDSVSEGMLLVATIAGWSALMDWAGYRYPLLRKLVEPPAVVLVRHGKLVARNLRRELITVPELMSRLRENGIEKLAEVKYARIESDGDISVIRVQSGGEDGRRAGRDRPGGG